MSRKVKLSATGALIGLIYGFFNIDRDSPERLLTLVGFIIGTMLIGLIGATIVDLFSKK